MSLSAILALGQTALELALFNSLTVLALFLSYAMLNVCDLPGCRSRRPWARACCPAW